MNKQQFRTRHGNNKMARGDVVESQSPETSTRDVNKLTSCENVSVELHPNT